MKQFNDRELLDWERAYPEVIEVESRLVIENRQTLMSLAMHYQECPPDNAIDALLAIEKLRKARDRLHISEHGLKMSKDALASATKTLNERGVLRSTNATVPAQGIR